MQSNDLAASRGVNPPTVTSSVPEKYRADGVIKRRVDGKNYEVVARVHYGKPAEVFSRVFGDQVHIKSIHASEFGGNTVIGPESEFYGKALQYAMKYELNKNEEKYVFAKASHLVSPSGEVVATIDSYGMTILIDREANEGLFNYLQSQVGKSPLEIVQSLGKNLADYKMNG